MPAKPDRVSARSASQECNRAAGDGQDTTAIAGERRAVYVRIDTIEQALRNSGVRVTGPEGYVAGYDIAAGPGTYRHRHGRQIVCDEPD